MKIRSLKKVSKTKKTLDLLQLVKWVKLKNRYFNKFGIKLYEMPCKVIIELLKSKIKGNENIGRNQR